MNGRNPLQAQECKGFFQEFYSFIEGVQKAGFHFREGDLQGNTRESGTGSDVHNGFYIVHIYSLDAAEAVQEMFHENLVKFCDTGEVHDFVFFYKIFVEPDKLVFLRVTECDPKLLAAFFQDF